MKDAYLPGVPKLTLKQAMPIVRALYESAIERKRKFINVFFYGKPGIGKTESVKKLARDMGISYMNIRLGTTFPTDFQGNPINITLDDGEIRQSYSTPATLPSKILHGEAGILLLDEFNMANNSLMGMAQQLLDSRRIGSAQLPPGWMVISCNNLRTHGAHVNEISMPNRSRGSHFNIEESLDDWINDFAIPSRTIHPLIISYLKDFPQHFYVLPKSNLEHAYPCPRTWEFASDFLYAGLEGNIGAAIGEAVAGDFVTYYALKDDLPDWSRVNDPNYKWDGKKNLSAAFAATITAVTRANKENFRVYLNFLFNSLGKEYANLYATSVQDAIAQNNSSYSASDLEFSDYIVDSKFPDGTDVFTEQLDSIKSRSAISKLF